eukprot:2497675-Prymnesium_polylepis.1
MWPDGATHNLFRSSHSPSQHDALWTHMDSVVAHIQARRVWTSIKITDFSGALGCNFADSAPGKLDLTDLSDFA